MVEKVEAKPQELICKKLQRAGIPAVEIVATSEGHPEGHPEYTYQPGISMDFYIDEHCSSDPGMVNGLVLEHQRYVEMTHDTGISTPDR